MTKSIIERVQEEANASDSYDGYTVRLVLKDGTKIHGAHHDVAPGDTSVAIDVWGEDGPLKQPSLHIAIDFIATAQIEW